MTSEGKGAADCELLRLIYLHLKENGYKKAANVLKKRVIQRETEVQTTLHEIYLAWIKTKQEPEVDVTPVRKARPPGSTREAEAETKCAAFDPTTCSDAAGRHPVVTSETRSSDGDSEEDAAVQISSLTAQAKARSAGPSKAETLTSAARVKPSGPEAAVSASESDSEDGLPAAQEPATIPRPTPARQPPTEKDPAVPVKDSLCAPLLPDAAAWPPAEGEAGTSDVERSAESAREGPATRQVSISQPSATPEMTGIGETSDSDRGNSDRGNSDRGNADAREDSPVQIFVLQRPAKQTPSTGGTVGPVKPLLFLSTPVLAGARRRTPAVEQGIGSLEPESSAESGAEDRAAQQKTLVAPKAKPFPAAPKSAVRSTSPALVQPTGSNPGPSTAPAEAAGGNSESQSEDGPPLTQVLFTKAAGGEPAEKPVEWKTLDSDTDMAVLEAPLAPSPQPVGLASSSSASSSSISTQKTSVLIKKDERRSADPSGREDGAPGAKAMSAPALGTSEPPPTLAGATCSTPAVGRGAGRWDTETKDRVAQQTVTAASKVLSKRTLKARTRNLLKTIEKIYGDPDSSGRSETLLAVSPKVLSSKSTKRLTEDEEESACVTVKGISAGCSSHSPIFVASKDLTCAVATSLEDSGTAEEGASQSLLDSKDAPVQGGEKKKRKGRKQATFLQRTSFPSSPNAEACEAAKTTTIGKDISLEDSTSKRLQQASAVAPPIEQEAICTLKTSTVEAKGKRRADKMDSPAKKKKKKRAGCSEGRGRGAESNSSQGVEKQETWALTLSDSDTSKEHPSASVNTAPTVITLSGEKKWRRMNKKKKKVKLEDVENGMSESTWKMEKVTPGKAKRDYPSEVSQEQVTVSRKIVRKSSSLKRALFTLDTTSLSSKKRKESGEGVTSKSGPENKTKVLKKKVKKNKHKQAEAGREGVKIAGSCEPVTLAGNLSALLRVKRREKNQIKQKNRKRKKMKTTPYRFLLDTLSPMRTSPEPD
ncbi:treacle protein-like isoform X4 [Brienomyrus brachyistius]|uniref:treacle protein-like isoform X4 n=1 Tax=Brienomyrus brachyistius TaxID=42636 RepID=UPI0020B29880|nr:treacle protein-like isoform X4 [Brienomyrus brachyistius]